MSPAAAALLATTAIQPAAAVLTLPAVAPLVAADLGVPTSLVGSYLAFVYVGAAASALIGGAAMRAFPSSTSSPRCAWSRQSRRCERWRRCPSSTPGCRCASRDSSSPASPRRSA
jgi:hypothetical protein